MTADSQVARRAGPERAPGGVPSPGVARRALRAVSLLLVLAAVGVLGWWAGRQTLLPPPDPNAALEPTSVAVDTGTVGRSLRLVAVAERAMTPLARNARAGVVTAIPVLGVRDVVPGDVLYEVDARPVVAAEGEMPFYRELAAGARGADVEQAQRLLHAVDAYQGSVDGVFGSAMAAAVRGWQRSLGVRATGRIELGDLVAVGSLPAQVALGEAVEVGTPLSGGEPAVARVEGDPAFVIPLGAEQRGLVPLDAPVLVNWGESSWPAEVVEAAEGDQGDMELRLRGADGGPVCGSDCAQAVPGVERLSFAAEILIVPETTGPVVPVAALHTEPDGRTWVRLADGAETDVEVRASSDGQAVVDGLSEGQRVLLPSPPRPAD